MMRYAILGASALLLLACSNGDDSASNDAPDATTDSPISTLPAADAAPEAEASVDAGLDAAPPPCSDAGLCRSTLPAGTVLRGVWGDGTGVVWAVSDTGSILRFDGTSWAVQTSNSADSYFSIWGTSATDIWVGGTSGLLHGTGTSSAALVFASVTTPGDDTVPISAIWGASTTDIWAVGGVLQAGFVTSSRGRAVHLVNGTWVSAGPAATNVAYSQVWGTTGSGVWISGKSAAGINTQAALYRKSATATTFAAIDLPPVVSGAATVNPSRIDVGVATADLSVVVLGAASTVGLGKKTYDATWRSTSTDAGKTFTFALDPPSDLPANVPLVDLQLTSGWAISPTDIWVAGLYGRLRHWDGTAWTEAVVTLDGLPETGDLFGIWGKADNDFWVVGDNLAIQRAP